MKKNPTFYDDVKGEIFKQMVRRGISIDELAAECLMTKRTFERRLAHPEDFRLKELKKIGEPLDIDISILAR